MSNAKCPCCGQIFTVSIETVHRSPGMSPAQQRVVKALADSPEGLSYDALEERVEVYGTSLRNSVYAARDALRNVGWTILTPGRGKDTSMQNNQLRLSKLDDAKLLEAV